MMPKTPSRKSPKEVEPLYEQFSIREGIWQQEPPHLRIVREGTIKGERDRGDLCILIEPSRGRALGRDVCDGLVRALAESYYQTPGSITRALREALLAANAWLFEANLRADSLSRALVGLGCAVIGEGETYLGQLGPALAYFIRKGVAQRFPADSIWLRDQAPSLAEMNREPPLGLRREVEPTLYRLDIEPGDTLLLATTDLHHLASIEEIADAVTYIGKETARDNLEALVNGRNASVLIIQWPGGAAAGPAARPVRLQPVRPSVAPEKPKAEAPQPPPQPEGEKPPVPSEEPAQAKRIFLPPPTAGEAASDEAVPTPPKARPQKNIPPADRAGTRLRETLSEGAERVRRETEEMLLRVLPSEAPERPPERPAHGEVVSLGGKALVGIALVIPLLVLFLVVMTRVQYDRVNREQIIAVRQKAEARCDAALKAQDVALVRQGLYDCLESLEEGLAVIPDEPSLVDLRNRALHRLDVVDHVERLYYFTRLTVLEDEPTSPSDSSRIVIVGKDLLLLNRGSGRLYRFFLNDVGDALQSVASNPLLIRKGETYDGTLANDLVDVGWLGQGGDRTVGVFAALDRTGSLFTYDPLQGVRVTPVANSDLWLKPVAMGTYLGNLYVLDPLLGRILKYMPVNNIYTTPPTDYLKPNQDVDLTGAVDMAIDGNVYILYADGRVRKFFNGEEKPFSMLGLPTPMRGPTSIFVSGKPEPEAEGYVYVVDAGNERILQFDKQGIFIRQFRAKVGEPYFQKLRGIYVNEADARLFVLSGNTLWLTNFPRLQGR